MYLPELLINSLKIGIEHIMAFNGSGTVGAGGGSGASGGDGPLNKRLCTGKENNEAGLNNNRVSKINFPFILCVWLCVRVAVCVWECVCECAAFSLHINCFVSKKFIPHLWLSLLRARAFQTHSHTYMHGIEYSIFDI